MKEVVINISENDIRLLKCNNYALCVAFPEKDMGYSVICYADMKYLLNNVINIGEELSVFYCNDIREGEKVRASAGPCSMKPGQRVTVDEYGSLKDVEAGGIDGKLEIINNYDSIYPGFYRSISFFGVQSELPAFVSPYASVKGVFTLEPEERMLIWFEQFAESGKIIDNNIKNILKAGKSSFIEVELSHTSVQVLYENQIWKKI